MIRPIFYLIFFFGVAGITLQMLQGPQEEQKEIAAPEIAPVKVPEASRPASQPTSRKSHPATLIETKKMKEIEVRYVAGDFMTALDLADRSLDSGSTSPNFRQWLKTQMYPLLASAGWAQLKLGRCDLAIPLFRRALSFQRGAESLKGLAVCHYKNKNYYVAEDHFGPYLTEHPEDIDMQLMFADVLESQRRYGDAVFHLESLRQNPALSEDRQKEVDQKLGAMRVKDQEGEKQDTKKSRYFSLSYRAWDFNQISERVMDTLEDSLFEFTQDLGFRPPSAQIETLLYPATQFRQIVPYGPAWAEGIFDGRIRIPVPASMLQNLDSRAIDRIVRHELVHALLAEMTDYRTIPSWFNEGMAQRLECPRRRCPPFQFPPSPAQFLDERSLVESYISFPALKAANAYAQSLYMVLTLETLVGGREQLSTILQSMTAQSDLSSQSLLDAVGLTYSQLHTKARFHWQKRTPLGRL